VVKIKKTFIKTLAILFNLLRNAYCCMCSISGTRDRDNFIQFVFPRLPYNLYCVGGDVKHCSLTHCCNSRLHIGLLTQSTSWRHSSRVAIGTACSVRNGYRAALHPATFIIKSRRINSFLRFQKWFSNFLMELSMNVFLNKNVDKIKNVKKR